MKEKDDRLNEKIKSSFGQMNKKAPDLLWNDLSASLDENAPAEAVPDPTESYLYQKIKESYSSQHRKAPSHVWQSINKQLNIDLVWTRVSKELDGAGGISRPRWQWAAVAAMFLFMVGFAGAYYLNQEDFIALSAGKAGVGIASPKTLAGKNLAGSSDVEKDSINASPITEKHQLPSPTSVTTLPDNSIAIVRASAHPLSEDSSALIWSNVSIGHLNELLKVRQVALNPLNLKHHAVLDSLESGYIVEAEKNYAEREESVLSKFSIGLALSYNNSWLLNNETQRSFDRGSLISTSPTFKESIGLTLGYKLANNSLVSTELHIAKNGQEYKTFGDGSYFRKGLELTYYKGYIQYQHNLLQNRKSLLSDITVKVGLFGGLLHKRRGELRDTESRYSRYDYGVRVALGQEKRIGSLIVDYGVSVERGLKNIFLGSESMPGRFNETYTLNGGPYLNFRFNP